MRFDYSDCKHTYNVIIATTHIPTHACTRSFCSSYWHYGDASSIKCAEWFASIRFDSLLTYKSIAIIRQLIAFSSMN